MNNKQRHFLALDSEALNRFVDATQHEKLLMHLWNSFKRKQRVVADGHIPWACEAFSTQHRQDFLQSPELFMYVSKPFYYHANSLIN
ncbi:putative polycomb protein, VEFS-Box [Helianthus anomalus]